MPMHLTGSLSKKNITRDLRTIVAVRVTSLPYGLARGIPYNELSEEEKRGRRHKNKVVLEAERQAKVALDKVEKYAVLATIDKQELTLPLLNINTPVQEAMDAVKKELAIPIPALIGQKTWREERTTNINDAIKALVTAINVERDKQNYGIRASVNKTYTYYMQQLNKLIIENMALRNENEALKAENAKVKQHISQLDENAVRRVTAQKDTVIESLNTHLVSKNEDIIRLKTDYNTLWEKYKILVLQWNDLTKQPEIIEAVKRVEERKEQEAEAKREEQARQDRFQDVLDQFISEGHEQLKAFSQSSRIDFDEKEAKAIYYGIMATATKSNIALHSPQGQYLPLKDFSRAWIGMVVATIEENVSHTGQDSLLPMRLFIPNPSFRTSFRSLITCRAAQIHTFHSVAPMVVLTNSLIGTEHRSWG